MDTGRNWMWPPDWPDGLRDCEDCIKLLRLLTVGWGLPERDEPSLEHRLTTRWHNRYKRVQWLEKLDEYRGGLPWHPSRGRPLLYTDDRETFEEAETPGGYRADAIPDHRLDDLFPEREVDGREENRLHPHIDPETVAGVVSGVADVLEHLEHLPTEELAGHFTDSFGDEWPPNLEAVHDVLTEWWGRYDDHPIPGQRKNNRRGVALRVATVLPFRGWYYWEDDPEPEGYSSVECDLTYDQLRPMLDRWEDDE